MINIKKKIDTIKTQNFLREFPIIFLVQHNNFTLNDWSDLRQKIQEKQETSGDLNHKSNVIEILTVKNSLLKKVLQTVYPSNKSNSRDWNWVLQGPNFIIGYKNEKNLQEIWDLIKLNPKLLFISCIYKNQLINHLDLEFLLKNYSSLYLQLINSLENGIHFYTLLHSQLPGQNLKSLQHDLLNTLKLIK